MSRPAIIDGDEGHLRRFQHDAPDLFQPQTTALDVIHFTNSLSGLTEGGVSEINTIGATGRHHSIHSTEALQVHFSVSIEQLFAIQEADIEARNIAFRNENVL
jgi:hypothetical protein